MPSSVKFLGRRDEEWIYIPMGMNCIWGFVFGGKSQFQMRNKQAMKGSKRCDKYSDIIGGSSRKSNNCRQSARESTSRAKQPCQQSQQALKNLPCISSDRSVSNRRLLGRSQRRRLVGVQFEEGLQYRINDNDESKVSNICMMIFDHFLGLQASMLLQSLVPEFLTHLAPQLFNFKLTDAFEAGYLEN